jgi:hypothetical protein
MSIYYRISDVDAFVAALDIELLHYLIRFL